MSPEDSVCSAPVRIPRGAAQHNAYIGAVTNHSNVTLYKLFSGLIDDVRIYTRALSEGETLWLSGQPAPATKPF